MIDVSQSVPPDPLVRAAGGFAIVSGIVAAIGVVFLIALFALAFATPYKALGYTFGMLNDICVAIQYLLTIPVALALHRILLPYNAPLIRIATIVGIAAMVMIILLQMLLVFERVTFQQQVGWVSLAILIVGAWLVVTGLVARSTGRLPNSVVMSAVAAPYVGYPVWAFWLGLRLLNW